MQETNKREILGLFPQPIFLSTLEGDFNEAVVKIGNEEMIMEDPEYGYISKNSDILDLPELTDLKKKILDEVFHFGNEILRFDHKEYTLTLSWLSHKNPDQHHAAHNHPNALLSGSFYYDTYEPSSPAIRFHKNIANGLPYIQPKYKKDGVINNFNQTSFDIHPSKNLLVLFVSHMMHSVPPNKSEKIRKSIAFNIFPKETLGDTEHLSELRFNKLV